MIASFLTEGGRRPSTSATISSVEPPSLRASPQLTMEPSIDGPPSPQGIRAYTEQMKRNVISSHGRTRTNSTVSSFSSDSASPELKRQGSKKSMRSERPDSIQIFGKSLFSRGSRKSKVASGRSSSLSLHQRDFTSAGARIGEEPSKKHTISVPYNFQHVVHTGIGQQNGDEVKSRASSMDDEEEPSPQRPHASSISDSDYTSDATIDLTTSIQEEGTPRPRRILRKPVTPLDVAPRLRSSQSHDSVRNAPPRPPRSPMIAMPMQMPNPAPAPVPTSLPPRTSSRTPSMVWEEYDPLASTSLERPHYASGFRKPQAFHLPLSPPLPADTIAQAQSDYFTPLASAPARPQENVGWPFAPQPSPSENGSQLADVPEEEELTTTASRQDRLSTASIRASRSVPNMLSRARADSRISAHNVPLPPTPTAFFGFAEEQRAQQPIKLNLDSFDSWEDDIDYCYDHEVEADCDYNWERTSIDTEIARTHFQDSAFLEGQDKFDFNQGSSPQSLQSASAAFSRRMAAQKDSHIGMPDPYLSPPSPSPDFFQLPEFEFDTNFSIGSPPTVRKKDSHKPGNLHLAAPRSQDFQESDGFTLSPSFLIPFDYAKQMDMESHVHIDQDGFRYEQRHDDRFASYKDRSSYGSDSNRLSDPHSTISIRSSNTSHTDGLRGSGGSSTSLANSFSPSSRHESVILERAAEVARSGRDVSAKNSMELRNAARSHSDSVRSMVSFSSNPFAPYIERDTDEDLTPMPVQHAQHSLSSQQEHEPVAMTLELARHEAESRLLPPSPSPCAREQSAGEEAGWKMMHGRNGSVPLLSFKSSEAVQMPRSGGSPKGMGRARASTVGNRGRSNYGLFPAPAAGPQQVGLGGSMAFPVMGNAF